MVVFQEEVGKELRAIARPYASVPATLPPLLVATTECVANRQWIAQRAKNS